MGKYRFVESKKQQGTYLIVVDEPDGLELFAETWSWDDALTMVQALNREPEKE